MSNIIVDQLNSKVINRITATAWVNFDGTGVVSIRESENVASIIDTGVGQYTVVFSGAMDDTNYATSLTTNEQTLRFSSASLPSFSVTSRSDSDTNADCVYAHVAVFGGKT